MHPADIKAALEKAGITQSSLAGDIGVSPTAVNRVIWSLSRSTRIEEKISKTIRKPLHQIWPDHYGRH